MTTKRDACDCLACKTSDGEACERASRSSPPAEDWSHRCPECGASVCSHVVLMARRSSPPLAASGEAEGLVRALESAWFTFSHERQQFARSALLAHLSRVEARAETAEAALNAEREPNGYPIASAETWRLRVCELERSLAAAEARAAEAERVANENAEAGFRAVAKLREAEERERGLVAIIRRVCTDSIPGYGTYECEHGIEVTAPCDEPDCSCNYIRAALSRSPSQPEGGGKP